MGLKNILGVGRERRTQLFFRDDGKFTFRKLPIQDTVLEEKINGEIKNCWKHFFQLQFPFGGYKGIGADMVTLGYARDIILDPYSIVPAQDKPVAGRRLDKDWITEVAETQRYKAQNRPHKTLLMDSLTIVLMVVVVILALCIGWVVAH